VTRELPPHLTLGLTLHGLKEWYARLPLDAVEQSQQINLQIKRLENGDPKFPLNESVNGYVNQYILATQHTNGAFCELLERQGSPYVGRANVFVSWYLNMRLETLINALETHLVEHPELRAESTFFWICDFTIRQYDVKPDLALLADCVWAVKHTLLLLEPWAKPRALLRAYGVKELYHTQASGGRLELAMSDAQRRGFENTLVEDFTTVELALSQVDVQNATCLDQVEQREILTELQKLVGFKKCNEAVIGLIHKALAEIGLAALRRIPAAEQSTSKLIDIVAWLLKHQGKLSEAE
jgi:hypothetical protein